jgi:hypothetical protein
MGVQRHRIFSGFISEGIFLKEHRKKLDPKKRFSSGEFFWGKKQCFMFIFVPVNLFLNVPSGLRFWIFDTHSDPQYFEAKISSLLERTSCSFLDENTKSEIQRPVINNKNI